MLKSIATLPEREIQRRTRLVSEREPDSPYPPGLLTKELRRAAVLIPFAWIDNAWHILMIHRSANRSDPHSSQVSFPGGGVHPSDKDVEMTALRETDEELAIRSTDVHLLGRLNDYLTITNYQVTPIIGTIPWPYPVSPDKREVTRAFTIPLAWLADPNNHEERCRELPEPFGSIPVIYFKQYRGEILWGASARIMIGLINALIPTDMQIYHPK